MAINAVSAKTGQGLKSARLFWRMLRGKPFQCLVQLTNRCNMSCDFCDFWPNGAKSMELSVADYDRLGRDLYRTGTFMISIEGGEPLVRRDCVDIVRALSKHHYTILFTNGWYVTPRIASELFAAGLNEVGVSIDYPAAAAHDGRRGVEGAFDRACAALRLLAAAAPNGGRQVHVMSVIFKENQQQLEALLQLSAGMGVGHYFTLVSDQGFRRGTRCIRPDQPVSAELLRLQKKFRHLRGMRAYMERIDTFLGGNPLPQCQAGRTSFNIDHAGQVSVCIEKINEPDGNVLHHPIEDILLKMRHNPIADQCQDCWTLCRGHAQFLGDMRGTRNLVDLLTRRNSI